MKIILFFLTLFLIFNFAISEENEIVIDTISVNNHEIILYNLKFSKPDSCGNALLSSKAYIVYPGKVIKIISPDLLEISVSISAPELNHPIESKQMLVHLSGVKFDIALKKEYDLANSFLTKILVGKDVQLLSNNIDFNHENEINAVIIINGTSINYTLLKNGLGSYHTYNKYDLDFWSHCKYINASKEKH